MFWILCDSPARRDDYSSGSGTDVLPLRFCPTRWVEDKPVAERGLMIWSNMISVAISKADTVIKKMKKQWLVEKNNHLENVLIDVGAATKDKLDNVLVSLEKKKNF